MSRTWEKLSFILNNWRALIVEWMAFGVRAKYLAKLKNIFSSFQNTHRLSKLYQSSFRPQLRYIACLMRPTTSPPLSTVVTREPKRPHTETDDQTSHSLQEVYAVCCITFLDWAKRNCPTRANHPRSRYVEKTLRYEGLRLRHLRQTLLLCVPRRSQRTKKSILFCVFCFVRSSSEQPMIGIGDFRVTFRLCFKASSSLSYVKFGSFTCE